jgi:hypothetical protein
VTIDPAIDLATPIDVSHHSDLPPDVSISTVLETIAGPSTLRSTAPRSPYPGLRAFRTEEAELFRGRDLYGERLVDQVRASPYVEVSGPVGSGPNLGHPRGADSATLRTGGSNSMR